MDLQAAPIVKGIFWLRAVPTMLRGQLSRPPGPRGLVEETLGLGFGVLAEVPNREIVVGTYSQPWHQQVIFHPLPPRSSPPSPSPGTSRSRTPSGPSRSGRAGPGLSPAPG
jgi:hypothetical protein